MGFRINVAFTNKFSVMREYFDGFTSLYFAFNRFNFVVKNPWMAVGDPLCNFSFQVNLVHIIGGARYKTSPSDQAKGFIVTKFCPAGSYQVILSKTASWQYS